MLIVDDNRVNLLKMKEKLLKLGAPKKDEVLNDYKNLAVSIDKEEYDALLDKIRKNDYTKLPLEDQILFLDEIESNYNSLNELEWGYKNTYSLYSGEELELSDIDNILIDNITNRRSAIEGYLMNKKNLENNKIELDRLNSELINLSKKQALVDDKIKSINESLKDNLVHVEGRIVGPKDELIYTSIVKEFEDAGIDLLPLVDNQNALDEALSKAYQDKKDSEEMVAAAKICYDEAKNETIYSDIKKNAKNSEYHLILLEIVHELCSDTPEFDLTVNKLYRVLNLIEERKYYLNHKFYIDPFDRLKIEDYIDELNNLGDCEEEIDNVKKTITYMISSISNMEEMNDEFVDKINQHCSIIKGDELLNVMAVDDYIKEDNKPTKVVKVESLPDDFMLDRAIEKTDSVINRVNKLFNNTNDNNDKIDENITLVTPELIIDTVNNNELFDEETNVVNSSEDVFEKEDNNKESDVPFVSEQEVFKDEGEVTKEDDLFKEVAPFEETTLFKDRYDEDVFDSVVPFPKEAPAPQVVTTLEPLPTDTKQVVEMPDAFWTIQEDNKMNSEDANNQASFDDQIEALIGTNNVSNTRRR